ncbi:peroxisome biogenesis factor 2 [Phlebotomus argentipes]|uniref:peroxisome biogenesis factor 2 n=1 Tax=Phlebotomus argentipes TaxID=94469 RepID=UPI002892D992|nr:peroxisome biogenesis factor 2 [Phlebotomus argentipes]
MNSKYLLRVNQLDALQLDDGIQKVFTDSLSRILDVSPKFLTKFHPELELLLRSVLWRFSIYRDKASFGQQMLFLRYNEEQLKSWKLALHFLFAVAPKYVKDKLTYQCTSSESLQRLLSWSQTMLNVLFLLNTAHFLRTGRSPGLADFLLRLEFCDAAGKHQRNIGYFHMTRELLWAGFIEFIGNVLPFVNYHKLKRRLRWFLGETYAVRREKMRLTDKSLCAFCNERPVLPHVLDSCRHIYCFYCLRGNLDADPDFNCVLCGDDGSEFEQISGFRR